MKINLSEDIQSLSSFKRDTSKFMKRLKKTGEPLVLTVNGKAELVVLDAPEYEKFLSIKDFTETVYGISQGLDSAEKGKGVRAEKFFDSFFKRNNIGQA